MRAAFAVGVFCACVVWSPPSAATEATPEEVAEFWNTIFRGPDPHGVPPLAATRTNARMVDGIMVWDVSFDSYRDPDTDLPVRIFGFLAIPNTTAPGPNGTYPGLVNTHSVGGCPTCNSPREGLDTAVYYARKGYASLAFFLRGYAPSVVSNPMLNVGSGVAFCFNMVGDSSLPFDTLWAGYAVDLYQAGELIAEQPEVWMPDRLSFIGHSLGGWAAVNAPIFSERYKVIAASAAPTTGSDIPGWMAFGNPIASCVQNLSGNMNDNLARAIRMVSFIGVHQSIDNVNLIARDATWRLDNTSIFFYGGATDPAVPPEYVAETYLLADGSNDKALHFSPIGGHGGPESFYRSEAWLDGHYPGVPASPPTALLRASRIDGLTVDFDASGSSDDRIMIAWDYDFGDGAWKNTGDTIEHTYAAPGTYRVRLTVTDGEARRDVSELDVTVGGAPAISFVVDARSPLVVDEGATGAFTVRLSAAPIAAVNVTIAQTSGDADLVVESGGSLIFSPADWDVPQTVTLAARSDDDGLAGEATFTISATGVPAIDVAVFERDDDARFSISIGTATVAPGGSASIPVLLTNPDGASVRAFSIELEFDERALGRPALERGAIVPGPAWWMFGESSAAVGTQTIAGSEFVAGGGMVVEGVLAIDRFTTSANATAGVYEIRATAISIDGRAIAAPAFGSIEVIVSFGGNDAGPEGPAASAGAATDTCSCRASSRSGAFRSVWIFAAALLLFMRRRIVRKRCAARP